MRDELDLRRQRRGVQARPQTLVDRRWRRPRRRSRRTTWTCRREGDECDGGARCCVPFPAKKKRATRTAPIRGRSVGADPSPSARPHPARGSANPSISAPSRAARSGRRGVRLTVRASRPRGAAPARATGRAPSRGSAASRSARRSRRQIGLRAGGHGEDHSGVTVTGRGPTSRLRELRGTNIATRRRDARCSARRRRAPNPTHNSPRPPP